MNGNTSKDFIQRTRQILVNGELEAMFNHLRCSEACPVMRNKLEATFTHTIATLNRTLQTHYNSERTANLERAMKNYSKYAEALRNMTKCVYDDVCFTEAFFHMIFCMARENFSLFESFRIQRNADQIKDLIFPRVQFRILNDVIKNQIYNQALKSVIVANKDNVISNSSGIGLLSLYASASKPSSVVAYEEPGIAELTTRVIDDNNTNILLLRQESGTVTKDCLHTVFLTDCIDSALFGDNILATLQHAWHNLLHENAKIVPGKAEFFILGVKCDDLNAKFQLSKSAKRLLNIDNINVHVPGLIGENYSEVDINLYDVHYMTEATCLLKADFNNLADIEGIICKRDIYKANLLAKETGEINAVIGWFNLYLTDNIVITTNPRSDSRVNAWHQAVFFDITPKLVQENESVVYAFSTFAGKLWSTPNPETVIRITPECLRFLNDGTYTNMIVQSVGIISVYLELFINITDINVLDLNPFPLLGLSLLKRGARSLTCHAKGNDKYFFELVFREYNVDLNRIRILETDHLKSNMFNHKFHVIFTNVLDLNGDVSVEKLALSKELKYSFLHNGGIFLPAKISLVGQLVNCSSLEVNNKVDDRNCLNFKIAEHANTFQRERLTGLDLEKLEFSEISHPHVLIDNLYNMEISLTKMQVLSEDTQINSIICWYMIELVENMDYICTNRSSSFVEDFAFMPQTNQPTHKGSFINTYVCTDSNGVFKIHIDSNQ